MGELSIFFRFDLTVGDIGKVVAGQGGTRGRQGGRSPWCPFRHQEVKLRLCLMAGPQSLAQLSEPVARAMAGA